MYPQSIDNFSVKLNKKENGVHIIEEKLNITNGVFDGTLAHDNINNISLLVYTGTKFSGTKILNYVLSIPSDTPWKRNIRIYSDTEYVYVTYETAGDTIEADDINDLQNSIIAIESELEKQKSDLNLHIENNIIDGGSFV